MMYELHRDHGPRHCFTLRQKPSLDVRLTDQQMFKQLPVNDVWREAKLTDVFFYLLQNEKLAIPDSWLATIMDFKKELEAFALWLQSR